jgi:hypothetical protein
VPLKSQIQRKSAVILLISSSERTFEGDPVVEFRVHLVETFALECCWETDNRFSALCFAPLLLGFLSAVKSSGTKSEGFA